MNTGTKLKAVSLGDRNAPGRLAEQHAKAIEKKRAKVRKAEDAYMARRDSIVSRGVARVKAIRVLRKELDSEEAALEAVIGSVE